MIMNVEELISFLENFAPEKTVLLKHAGTKGFWTIADVMATDGFPILCILEPGK